MLDNTRIKWICLEMKRKYLRVKDKISSIKCENLTIKSIGNTEVSRVSEDKTQKTNRKLLRDCKSDHGMPLPALLP